MRDEFKAALNDPRQENDDPGKKRYGPEHHGKRHA